MRYLFQTFNNSGKYIIEEIPDAESGLDEFLFVYSLTLKLVDCPMYFSKVTLFSII